MGIEDTQHLLASLWQKLLRITGIRDWFSFLSVSNSTSAQFHTYKKESAHSNLMWRRTALGISRTNIHLTLNTPFHLSDAQTVLLLV
jgi:hypothetical protein